MQNPSSSGGTRLTSLSLVDGLLSREEKYWLRLSKLYGPVIDYWVQKAGIPQSSLADVRQEVLLGVLKSIESYKHSESKPGTLRRWIWGIARNKIADFHRKELGRGVAAGGTQALNKLKALPEDPYEESDPDTAIRIRKELVARAIRILEADFEEKTWQAFMRTVVASEPSADVAQALGMSKQAVRQARYRVLRRLRSELGDELEV